MWYLTLHRPRAPREERLPYLDEHLAWNYQQQQDGVLLFSGPTSDGEIGIIVLRARNLAEARAIMDSEPYVRRGLRTYEIYEWDIHQVLGVGGFSRAAMQALREHNPKPQS